MNLLAIDTSTECASVALIVNGDLRSEEQGAQRQHARLLLPMIEGLLAEAEISLNQVDAIVYGRGPGSFTGLRIACSVAKGLAYAHDLPLFPVSSLAAIANEAMQEKEKMADAAVLAMIDARMNQVYWACFIDEINEAEEQVSEMANLKLTSDCPLIVAGVGYEPYLSQLPIATQSRIVSHSTLYPNARAMIRLALSGRVKPVSAAEAVPVYVRNQITQGEVRG